MASSPSSFDLDAFLPYRLNLAAEQVSREFAALYRARHGLSRAEWRVMAHLGHRGALTATAIAARTLMHKTKISRAVAALEGRGWLSRERQAGDRRQEALFLTAEGQAVFAELGALARAQQARLDAVLGADAAVFRRCLDRLTDAQPLSDPAAAG